MNRPAQLAPKKPARQQPPGRPQAARNRGLVHSSLYIVMGALLVVGMGAWGMGGSKKEGAWNVRDEKLRNVGKGDFAAKDGKGHEDGTPQGKYKDPEDWMAMDSSLIKAPSSPGADPRSRALSRVELEMKTLCPEPPKVGRAIDKILENVNKGGGGGSQAQTRENLSSGTLDTIKEKVDSIGRNGIAHQRWGICIDIVETRHAQAKYNLMMSELAAQRYKRLEDLREARGKISSNEAAGELQSNTNAMVALLAQIQIDQQQQKAYNDAYAARLAYLQQMQDSLGQNSAQGQAKLGSALLSEGAAQLVLKLVLENEALDRHFD